MTLGCFVYVSTLKSVKLRLQIINFIAPVFVFFIESLLILVDLKCKLVSFNL